MVFPISIAALWTELFGRRHPPHGSATGKTARQLRGGDAKPAQIVSNHAEIPEARNDFSAGPDAVCKKWPEEFVGHDAIIGQPIGVRTDEGSRARQTIEAAIKAELLAELVARHCKKVLLVRGVHRPENNGVNELGTAYPAFEKHHDPV